MNNDLPVATQWLLNSNNQIPTQPVLSVVLVATSKGQKGTGWLVSENHVVTNEHVIRGCRGAEVQVQFSDGVVASVIGVVDNALTDVALLRLKEPVGYKPLKIIRAVPDVGLKICAWGHPLGYSGPAPILSVGYVAGFNSHQPQGLSVPQQRIVLNAAINPGNSGGPILIWGGESVCGMAVTKHAPITAFIQSAIDALKSNGSGVVFSAQNGQGATIQFVESQLVADVLQYFRNMTQVVIGEAIASVDIIAVLDSAGIPWQEA